MTAFVFAVLAGMTGMSFAQNNGQSPAALNPLVGNPGSGPGKMPTDLPGKAQPAAAVTGVPPAGRALDRVDDPPGSDMAPPRLEGAAKGHGVVKGKKIKVSGSLSETGGSAVGSSRPGAAGKRDIRHLPTCD